MTHNINGKQLSPIENRKNADNSNNNRIITTQTTSMMHDIDMPAMSSLRAATSYTSTSLHDAVKLHIGKQGLAACAPQTIPQFFRDCCQRYAQLPALVYEAEHSNEPSNTGHGNWTSITYEEYWRRVEQTALILLHVGLQPRSSVGILAFNCPEWFYTELGTLRAGGVVAGIYPSNSPEAVRHVLDTSEATVCVVDDAQQMAKVRAVKSRLPRLRAVLQLHGPYEDFVGVDEGYYRWEDLWSRAYDSHLQQELERRERDVGANECAVLIFTSGTVGMPKAVMLSHDAVICDAKAVSAALPDFVDGAEVAVTYLPLNHIAAQMFDIFLNFQNGGCIYFADRNALKGTLGRTLAKAKPTRLFGVPRIYEKMQEKLDDMEAKSSNMSKYILNWARQTTYNYHMQLAEGKSPSLLKYWLAAKIMRQIKVAMGLDLCKSFLIGGAPVSEELKRYFMSLDMPLTEVYGLSETGGAATIATDRTNFKTVGKALDGIELKIYNPDCDGQGEICIRGRTCCMGYLNEPGKTKEFIKDGWLYSGDLGYLDTDGNLVVCGRIKELIITAGGENIPPVYIETYVKRELKGISNAVVVGDRKKYLTILLTIKTEMDQETGMPTNKLHSDAVLWLESLGLKFTLLSDVLNIPADIKDLDASNVEVKPNKLVIQSIEEGLQRANKNAISHAQKVQKFALLPHDFSIPTGELGPTLKVRRNIVLQKYANVIEQMYK